MADKHPYVSGSGPLFQMVNHLRKLFPIGGATADTLKKLGLAPNNESYVINILRFIDIIDEEGKKTEAAGKVFNQHEDAAFQTAFAGLVKSAYSDLLLHGDEAWKLGIDALIQYFRSTDDTSAIVGRRQATTFQGLSALSGQCRGSPSQSVTPQEDSGRKGFFEEAFNDNRRGKRYSKARHFSEAEWWRWPGSRCWPHRPDRDQRRPSWA